MTDNHAWQPPGQAPAAGQPAAPQFTPPSAPFSAPGGTPSGPSLGGVPPQAHQTGWVAPPKPGLIPLRPLSFGNLLGASFQVLRRNPRSTFGVALVLNGILVLLSAGIVGTVAALAFARVATATIDEQDQLLAGSIGAVILSMLVPLGLSVVVTAILQGIVALEVARGTLGEKLRFPGLWRLAKGRIGALIGWSFLLSGAGVAGIVVVVLIVALFSLIQGAAGIALAVLSGIGLGLALVVASVWIGVKLSLVPSVLMLERTTLRESITRSWRLTNGFFWKAFGIQLLVSAIVQTASQIIVFPVAMLFSFGSVLLNPNGDQDFAALMIVLLYLVTGVIGVVLGAVASVIQSAVVALIYIDIRMRTEGLDLELIRFVEARQIGDTSVANPYLVVPSSAQAWSQPTAQGSGSPWA